MIIKYFKYKFKNPRNFFVSLKRKIIVFFYRVFNVSPSSAPFLSGDTFLNFSTFVYSEKEIFSENSEIIFVQSDLLKSFQNQVKKIKKRFILISHNGDDLIDKEYKKLLNNKYLIKWYSANTIIRNKKITPIPLGLQNSRYHHFGIVRDFKNLRAKYTEKKPKILCSFDIRTNMKKRKIAQEILRDHINTDIFSNLSAHVYREKLCEYMFQACPEGNGLDTYRAWESLYLNVIPIVIKNNFYSQFVNLPMLTLNNWTELKSYKANDLKRIYKLKLKKLKYCKYIWSDYWIKDIKYNCKNFN